MQKNTARRRRTARTLTVLGTAGAAAAGLALVAVPAHATIVQPVLHSDRVEFLGYESNADVSGTVTFTIRSNGDWNIRSSTRNGRPAFRWVHWTCRTVVTDGSTTSTISVSTPAERIRRKSNHTFDVSGTSTNFATAYSAIINPAVTTAHCDIHFGR